MICLRCRILCFMYGLRLWLALVEGIAQNARYVLIEQIAGLLLFELEMYGAFFVSPDPEV